MRAETGSDRELTGREKEPSELIYFKVYMSQIPVIEQAIETATLMLKIARLAAPSFALISVRGHTARYDSFELTECEVTANSILERPTPTTCRSGLN